MIVVLTETGTTPRLIAKYRPSMPILALTAIPETVSVRSFESNFMTSRIEGCVCS
jgi:pyruvate kinase